MDDPLSDRLKDLARESSRRAREALERHDVDAAARCRGVSESAWRLVAEIKRDSTLAGRDSRKG